MKIYIFLCYFLNYYKYFVTFYFCEFNEYIYIYCLVVFCEVIYMFIYIYIYIVPFFNFYLAGYLKINYCFIKDNTIPNCILYLHRFIYILFKLKIIEEHYIN